MEKYKKIAEIDVRDKRYKDQIIKGLESKGLVVIVDGKEGYDCYLDVVSKIQN